MDQKDSRKLVEQALRVLKNEPIAMAEALSDEELKWIKWWIREFLEWEERKRMTESEIKKEKWQQRKDAWYKFVAAGIFSAIIGPIVFIFVQPLGFLSPGGDPPVSVALACGITGGLMAVIGSKMK